MRTVRELLGLTQEAMAERFAVARSALAQWESGKNPMPGPARRLLEAWEDELGLDDGDGDPEASLVPTNRIGRTVGTVAAMLYASIALGGASLGQETALRRSIRRAALQRLVDVVDGMKGFSKKLGQLLFSLEFVLSEDDRALLASLYTNGPAMSARDIDKIFLADLGAPARELFATWENIPVATASIGQVHKARLRTGEAVAVKVQYPGIVDALRADMQNLGLVDQLVGSFWRGQRRGILFEEVRERLMDECDYAIEARHQRDFAAHFGLRSGMKIPSVFDALSGHRVLVTEWSDGASFDTFARSAPSSERNRAAEAIWDFYYEASIRHGVYCIDPHPGNCLFERGRVVFLDFGAVKRLSPAFVMSWKALMRAVAERDLASFRSILLALDCVREVELFDFHAAMRAFLVFFKPWLRDEPYHFDSAHLRRMWEVFGPHNPNVSRISYSSDMAFMGQLSFGVHALLSRLGAEIAPRSRVLSLLYAPGERLPPPFGEAELREL